jgi:transcription antitermination factor NusG
MTSLTEDGEALSSGGNLSAFGASQQHAGLPEQPALAPPQQWFAAYTTPRHEKAVVRQLEARHVEAFLPLYTSVRRWSNGCKVVVEQPLFPGYVFIHIQRKDTVQVLQAPGVVSIVGNGRAPSALSSGEIESIRAALPQRCFEPHPYVAVGDKVRVIEGPLAGMSGILLRKKNNLRVVLTLELILQSVAVEIGMHEIEPFRQ